MARKSQPFRESDKEQLKQDAGEALDKSKDVAEDLANLGAHTAQDTKAAASDKADSVRQSARQAGRAANEEAAALKEQGANVLGQAQQATAQKVSDAQKGVKNVKDAASRQAGALAERGQDLAANAQANAQDLASRTAEGARQQAQHARDAAGDARDIAAQEAKDLATQGSDLLNEAVARIPSPHSLLDTVIGQEYSFRRTAVAFVLAFWSATIVRVICISPSLPVFGPHLSQTLAPIERDDVSWAFIALQRVIDLALAVTIYSSEGTKMDAPFLGVLLTCISRPTLYQFFHHHFLLSTKTVTEVLLTDAAASATSLFVISKLLPAPPTFRPPPIAWFKRHLNSASFQSIALALGLGTLLSALVEFVTDRVFLHQMMRAGVLEHLVPSYYASNRPSGAFIQRHPLLPVPTLRNDFSPLTMPQAIINGAPFALSFTIMSLFVLPQLPTRYLSTVVALLTGPAAFLTLWNLLPVHPYAAAGAATVMAARQAAVATVIAWVLTDLRRPVESSSVEVVKVPIRGREIDGSRVVESRKEL